MKYTIIVDDVACDETDNEEDARAIAQRFQDIFGTDRVIMITQSK